MHVKYSPFVWFGYIVLIKNERFPLKTNCIYLQLSSSHYIPMVIMQTIVNVSNIYIKEKYFLLILIVVHVYYTQCSQYTMLLVIIVTIRCSAANKCNLMLTVVPILQNYHTKYLNNKMISLVHHPSMKAASIAEKTLFNFILSCLSKYIAFLFE